MVLKAKQNACSERTVVVIPARNESLSIAKLVTELKRQHLAVIVVDDHSTDTTSEEAARAGAQVLRLPFHAGAWFAMQTGLRAALEKGYQVAITMDADGQHSPEDIPRLISVLNREDDQPNVVIGSCIERGNRRRQLAWRVLRWLSGLDLADMTSGFRVYDAKAMAVVADPSCTLIEYQDIGILLRLSQSRLKLEELPVEMQSRAHGQSRIFKSWSTVLYYLTYSALLSVSRRQYASDALLQKDQ